MHGAQKALLMKYIILLFIALSVLFAGCSSPKRPKGQKWTETEIKSLQGKTRAEVQELLGKPNGFYTRSSEGRWHYSDVLLDQAGAGNPRRVWIVIYFSQYGEQRATRVEIHEHTED